MKQAIKNIRVIILTLTVFFSAGFTQKTTANPNPNPENAIELKLADSIYGHPVFRLKIGNENQNQFSVRVLDADGAELYHEILKGKDISRRYMMNLEEEDLNNIRFEITNLSTRQTEAYNIKRNTLVENLVVAKL